MRAAFYERPGQARDVLDIATVDDPNPGPGEVRLRVHASGINPGDIGKRGRVDAPMPFPRVVPHSDGAGVIDAVGDGVPSDRIGERAWCFGAQSYRPFGTAAELAVVPAWQAVSLPDNTSFEEGACLGIPGITAHHAVFADGSVADQTVLVVGAAGAVGSIASAFAAWCGALVVGVVHNGDDAEVARAAGAHHVLLASDPGLAQTIASIAPDGVDRIVDVAFDAYAQLYADIIAPSGTITTYFSRDAQPRIPYWPLLFKNITIRLLGSDDFSSDAKSDAAIDINTCLREGRFRLRIGRMLRLEQIAVAHEAVEQKQPGRTLITLAEPD